jgi:hypothetical protein
MIQFKTNIERFREKGEKSGWTYIEVPLDIAEKLYPGYRKAFRVKGSLDKTTIKGVSLTPMGEGNFILAINSSLRKKIKKNHGDQLLVVLERDQEEPKLSAVFLDCLEEDKAANDFFHSLPRSHQRYFSNWIESAKTEGTKTKRIAQAMNGLASGLGFGAMIRSNKHKG